jgi:hypothetical protein
MTKYSFLNIWKELILPKWIGQIIIKENEAEKTALNKRLTLRRLFGGSGVSVG